MAVSRTVNALISADELPGDVFAEGSLLHVSGYSLMRPGSSSRTTRSGKTATR